MSADLHVKVELSSNAALWFSGRQEREQQPVSAQDAPRARREEAVHLPTEQHPDVHPDGHQGGARQRDDPQPKPARGARL